MCMTQRNQSVVQIRHRMKVATGHFGPWQSASTRKQGSVELLMVWPAQIRRFFAICRFLSKYNGKFGCLCPYKAVRGKQRQCLQHEMTKVYFKVQSSAYSELPTRQGCRLIFKIMSIIITASLGHFCDRLHNCSAKDSCHIVPHIHLTTEPYALARSAGEAATPLSEFSSQFTWLRGHYIAPSLISSTSTTLWKECYLRIFPGIVALVAGAFRRRQRDPSRKWGLLWPRLWCLASNFSCWVWNFRGQS